MAKLEAEIEIRLIEPGDRVTGLSLGDEKFTPLKIFLQKYAKDFQDKNLARTYAMFDKGNAKILGYVTLVCGEIVLDDGEGNLVTDVEYKYDHYPAVKIARLAVDRRVRGNSLGKYLAELSLGIAKDIICPAVGCRFVVVDSKQDAVGFYLKCGFTMLDTQTNRQRAEPIMFVDLHKT